MKPNNKPNPCPPELLKFCRAELEAARLDIDESLEHLSQEETLAALGALVGLGARLALAGTALQLLGQLYPKTSARQP